MSINFKIYFPKSEKEKENIVLLKGDLAAFSWNELKEKIIQNSKNLYFKSINKELNNDDIFKLKLIEDKEDKNKAIIKEIYDDRTLIFFVDKTREQNKGQIILVKFELIKSEEIPKSDLPNYDLLLKKQLNEIWKREKERIKYELDESELVKRNIYKLNILYKHKIINNQVNKGIKCDICQTANFSGNRYICSYCNNYNLCYFCFKKYKHEPKHNFVIIKESIEENIIKYNNILSPKIQYFKNIKESFKAKFKLVNIGENNLKDCYFNYINFNDNNLICKKYIINDDLIKNTSKEIELEINFNNIQDDYYFYYEGHFRMFNKDGIPFGDILIIKLNNDFLRN